MTVTVVRTRDEDLLAAMGVEQELKREWGLIQNFGVSFSIISVITGITSLFYYGLTVGGPTVMLVGWICVSFFTFFVGFSMAEIVSAIPSSGGPYFWAACLAPAKYSPFLSYATGIFNFVGQFAVTTGITFGLAGFITTAAQVKNDYTATSGQTIGVFAALLVSHGIVNTFGVKILKYLNNTSICLHSLGIFSLCVAVLAKCSGHFQSSDFVWKTFTDDTGVDGAEGWSQRASPAYVAVCGILIAQFTITGFDASAHLSEETKNATKSAPIGLLMAIGCSFVFGFFVMMTMLYSIRDYDDAVASGMPVLAILLQNFSTDGALVLWALICVCVWHCGLFSITSNSRMFYSFARDSGIPKWFAHVDPRFKSPTRTIWLAVVLAFCLGLPSLGSAVALTAATSIATIGLYISYALPILAMAIWPDIIERQRGHFHLGKFSRPCAIVACLWVGFITVVFCLPTSNPVGRDTLNYTCVCVGIVMVFIVVSWFFPYFGVRTFFTGPLVSVDADQIGDTVFIEGDEIEIVKSPTGEKLARERQAADNEHTHDKAVVLE